MVQDHTAYPNITRLTLDMVACNGGLHRLRKPEIGAEQDVKNLLDECLGAEGVYHEDLAALDRWLSSLTEEQFMTVADGEETEVATILEAAPRIGDSEDTVREFIDQIYEHCI
jgi:hypothetical protein